MIIRIKGKVQSKGNPPRWARGWPLRNLFAKWDTLTFFDFQKELDLEENREYNLNADWSIRIDVKEEIATIEIRLKEIPVAAHKFSFKDLEWKFSAGVAGQRVNGSILVDF